MSKAIFLKLPIIVLTWPTFSSISSSRASFVILTVENRVRAYEQERSSTGNHSHTSHKAIHLISSRSLPADVARLWTNAVPFIHHSRRLIVYYFAVVVTLPGAVVFLE